MRKIKEEKFPIIKVGYIFNKFNVKVNIPVILNKQEVELKYPCRLDSMAINPVAICYNDSMILTPGEVVISLKKFIKVKIDEENLKVVQCIGGGATNGLTEEGIIIIAGKSTAIAKMKYVSKLKEVLGNNNIEVSITK